MTRDELLAELRNTHDDDNEIAHAMHDEALLKYIDDKEISQAFWNQTKWYA